MQQSRVEQSRVECSLVEQSSVGHYFVEQPLEERLRRLGMMRVERRLWKWIELT